MNKFARLFLGQFFRVNEGTAFAHEFSNSIVFAGIRTTFLQESRHTANRFDNMSNAASVVNLDCDLDSLSGEVLEAVCARALH